MEICEQVLKMSGLPKFLCDRSGSFSVATALMILPALTGVLVAYDYSRFDQLKNHLRAAVQAAEPLTITALPMGHIKEDGLDAYARESVLAKLGDEYAADLSVHVELTRTETGKIETATFNTTLQYKPITGPLLAVFEGKSPRDYSWTARTP